MDIQSMSSRVMDIHWMSTIPPVDKGRTVQCVVGTTSHKNGCVSVGEIEQIWYASYRESYLKMR